MGFPPRPHRASAAPAGRVEAPRLRPHQQGGTTLFGNRMDALSQKRLLAAAAPIAALLALALAPAADAARRDLDHDGLSNRFELKRSHTKPRRADTDRDYLRDGFEV